MITYYLDTNIILRYLLHDVPAQYDVVAEKIDDCASGKIKMFISKTPIIEAFYVLTKLYNRSVEEVVDRLLVIIYTDFIEVESRGVISEALELVRLRKISFPDAIILLDCEARGCSLLTFDKKLQALSKLAQR